MRSAVVSLPTGGHLAGAVAHSSGRPQVVVSVISLTTARRLRDAGLEWSPREGDRFVIPDRGMDERVFTVSAMVVEVREGPAGPFLAFNGTVEWALDAIMKREVVWLPREAQLRVALGDAFVRLERSTGGLLRVTTEPGREGIRWAADAAEAYAAALLDVLGALAR